ncbi:MAG: 6-bladed beta-propeller [Bacteroidales bacterium]|jgi:hypothetical protein|nr:6-bladed beta-propeller [Bacteroidales bacterium]
MKNLLFTFFLLVLLLVLGVACETSKLTTTAIDELITIDINDYYPADTIKWKDEIESIEYIALETTKDFLCAPGKIVAFNDDIIIYSNYTFQDGINEGNSDIFIFDSKGKGLKKINRTGSSDTEYSYKTNVIYDDKAKELFIYDAILAKIFVYDLDGNFKRILICPKYAMDDPMKWIQYNDMQIFDDESIICYINSEFVDYPFSLISKRTGEKLQDIAIIPSKERTSPFIHTKGGRINIFFKNILASDPFILKDSSSDTIYSFSLDRVLKPIAVQEPSVKENKEHPIFLFPAVIENNYLMLKFIRKGSASDEKKYEISLFLLDGQENKIYKSRGFPFILETDVTHSSKQNVRMNFEVFFTNRDIHESMAPQLKELLSKRQEDDNPILRRVIFKK